MTHSIKLSATEVASVGLPARGCHVDYDDRGRLCDYSAWLGKSGWHEPLIDRLVAIADDRFKQLH